MHFSRNSLLLILLILISATGVVLLATQNRDLSSLLEHEKTPQTGDPAFLFQSEDLSGKTVDLRSGNTIVVFFTSECESCIKAMPLWQDFYSGLDATKFQLVGVSANPEPKVRALVEEHQLTFPIVVDSENAVHWKYHVKHFPLTVIVRPEGTIAWYQEPRMTAKQALSETEVFVQKFK